CRRVLEHHRALLVSSEPEDGLKGLILAHMLEERVGRLAVVFEVSALARPVDGLAGEGGPLLDDRIAEVPTAEYCPEVQLTESVRAGDVAVVIDCGDVVLDAVFDLTTSFLRGDDTGLRRCGKRVL